VSNKPRLNAEEKKDYFHHFLDNKPKGRIDRRQIQLGCNTAFDVESASGSAHGTGRGFGGRWRP
jgi:hypothetical protein